MNGDKKNATSIGTIIWTNNGCLPMEHVLPNRTLKTHHNNKHVTIHILSNNPIQLSIYLKLFTCTAWSWWVSLQVLELLHYSLGCHLRSYQAELEMISSMVQETKQIAGLFIGVCMRCWRRDVEGNQCKKSTISHFWPMEWKWGQYIFFKKGR